MQLFLPHFFLFHHPTSEFILCHAHARPMPRPSSSSAPCAPTTTAIVSILASLHHRPTNSSRNHPTFLLVLLIPVHWCSPVFLHSYWSCPRYAATSFSRRASLGPPTRPLCKPLSPCFAPHHRCCSAMRCHLTARLARCLQTSCSSPQCLPCFSKFQCRPLRQCSASCHAFSYFSI